MTINSMTIEEAAGKVYGVSKSYIYRKLKAKGVPVASIRDSEYHITEEGWAILDQHFPRISSVTAQEASEAAEVQQEDKHITEELEALRKRSEALSDEVADLQEQLKDAQHKMELVEGERDHLRQQLQEITSDRDYLRGALMAAQQTTLMTAAKLPAPGGFLHNLFHRKPKEKKDQPL